MKRNLFIAALVAVIFSPASSPAADWGSIAGSVIQGTAQLAEAAKDITPSEEHYIGRAVAAMVLAKYPLLNNASLNRYLNEVGLTLAAASERPNTYGGYHFAVLSGDEPNAFACPGGIILVNRGLLREIQNEDQLAAILAHEVAHVADRHGINAIKKSRWTKLGFYAAGEVGKRYTPGEVSELVGEFQNVVTDVAKKVIDSGYSKSDEKKADEQALRIAWTAGYNPAEMLEFVKTQQAKGIGDGQGPFASHPKPESRVRQIEGELGSVGTGATEKVRTARFKAAMAGIR